MSNQKKGKPKPKKAVEKYAEDMLDAFHHPDKKVCDILPTSSALKKNAFTSYRPPPGTCLDYKISQTDTKLDAGTTKIHVQQTEATYEYSNPENPDSTPAAKENRKKRKKGKIVPKKKVTTLTGKGQKL